jgi:taurine dioxygenase
MSAPLGAEIHDIDVSAVSDNEWQAIHQLFLQHHVLAFPGQNLTPEQHMAFGRRWGELVRHPYGAMADYPDLLELKNAGKRRDVNQHWHSDMTYNPAPPKLTMLYGLQTPEIGGDTAFSNQVIAYAELSDGLKALLANLTAEHTADGRGAPGDPSRGTHP